jgi:taurine--2-oxoglutarate transaminase
MTDTTQRASSVAGADRAYELDRAHVFHSWSAQGQLDPLVVTKAEGSYIWDRQGNRLLDFTSQLVFTNLGHQHPRIVKAIQEQAATLCTVAPAYVTGARSEAARLIVSHTPDGMSHVFFTNGGADANEHAIRMARLHTGRHKVLSTYRSYHGGTHLAVNVTGDPRRWASDTGSAGTGALLRPLPLPQRLRRYHRVGGVPAGARSPRAGDRPRGAGDDRGDHAGVDPRHRRHHGPAAWLP